MAAKVWAMITPGADFGRYRLAGVLGHGGFATVYRGWDQLLSRYVAIKVLHPALAADARMRDRFLREARQAARLRHPNIVTVHDVGEHEGHPFFTMELIEGETLASWRDRRQRPEPAMVARVIAALCGAVDYLHAEGIVHRDIKASNVIRGPDGRVVLMDFGIARAAEGAPGTSAGVARGTPEAMAPEQALGLPVGRPADIYALGVLAYSLYAGRPPFLGEPARVMFAHAYEAPPPLAGLCPGLPAHVVAAVAAAMAKESEQRPSSAGAFAAALTGVASAAGATPRQTHQQHGRRRWVAVGAVVVVAAVAALAGGLTVLSPTRAGRQAASSPSPASVVATATPSGPIVTSAAGVTTLAGDGAPGYLDGPAAAAQFAFPTGITRDLQGTVYVSDTGNNRIRKIMPDGTVTTLAGSGQAGYADGPAATAEFNVPSGLTVDLTRTVYVAELGNHRIRKIAPDGTVSTLAGSGVPGYADGRGAAAQFNAPMGLTTDAAGNLYVAEAGNHRVRRITPDGTVTTLAGSGTAGFADGPGSTAQFHTPAGVTADAAGNIYVAEVGNARIRRIAPDGTVTTFAGTGAAGFADGPAAAAQFNQPVGISIDITNTVYVTDAGNFRVRMISPRGVVSTLAGSGDEGFADGPAASARFLQPAGIVVVVAGAVSVADAGNSRIRTITVAAR